MSRSNSEPETTDAVLIGAGIMSATLGMLLKQLEPDMSIIALEKLGRAAAESSDAWNNAGTGHSGFCELNYTPLLDDGSVDISKAVQIAESFEVSKQFWAYLVRTKVISIPDSFIERIPHMSVVWGDDNVQFLRARYKALKPCSLFNEMQYTEEPARLAEWMPLIMQDRMPGKKMAATRVDIGTDVNFGTLTRSIFTELDAMEGVSLHFRHEVRKLKCENKHWIITSTNLEDGRHRVIKAKFVFIGAGGGSLPLLLKSGIPEGKGFGGFPVSGQWLRCTNPDIIKKHQAKVYGKASTGSPPMSVPHLDTRMIQGEKALLFGPFAGFTTKFLKNGSVWDLLMSIRLSNLKPMIMAGLSNINLTKYLIEQVKQSPEDRLNALRQFVPTAKGADWELEIAGQRVQVIKKDAEEGGILEFGTEVVSSADGTMAALLGASPGASTAVSIMINLLKECFPEKIASAAWQNKLKEMIPSYGKKLGEDPELCQEVRQMTAVILNL